MTNGMGTYSHLRVATAITLFLFPLAGNSVTGWSSYLFTLICLLSLFNLSHPKPKLDHRERKLLALVVLLFTCFMISNLVNGWGPKQTSELGVEVRYILFIPLYLLLRSYPQTIIWLMLGAIGGVFIAAGQSLYDIYTLGLDRAYGIYKSPGFLAMGTLMLSTLTIPILPLIKKPLARNSIIVIIVISCIITVILSGSRSAYLALIGWLIILLALHFGWRGFVSATLGTVILGWILFTNVDIIHERSETAVNEIAEYLATEDKSDAEHYFGSTAQRFPLWHAAILMYRDNPVWGVGRGNYNRNAKLYAQRGELHPLGAIHPHPHSGYLEIMASNGTVGLTVFLTLLGYIAWMFRTGTQGVASLAGWAFSLLVIFTALFEPCTFIYGNFLALYLIVLAGLSAWQFSLSSGYSPTSTDR